MLLTMVSPYYLVYQLSSSDDTKNVLLCILGWTGIKLNNAAQFYFNIGGCCRCHIYFISRLDFLDIDKIDFITYNLFNRYKHSSTDYHII